MATKTPADSGIRSEPFQGNFTAGEFSPFLEGQVNLRKYPNAMSKIDNFEIWPHGPMDKRAGSRFITTVKTQSLATRLVPFIFSTVQAYIIEFGNLYCRFYKDEAQILSGTAAYEIVSPYSTADLPELKFVQSADVLYICHSDYRPQELTRTGHTAWAFSDYIYGDGPYQSVNTTATTLTPSATTGAITITASAALFTSAAVNVGQMVRIEQSSEWGCAIITGFTSTTIVSATVVDDEDSAFLNTTGVTTWRLGSWYGPDNWPSAKPTFFENRLVFAHTTAEPNGFWCSRTNDFNSHKPTTRAGVVGGASAINRLITDNQVNAIYWLMVDNSSMFAGTSDGPFRIWSGSTSDAFSPTAIAVDKQNKDGAGDIEPLAAGDGILYVSRSTTKVRELSYSFEKDKHLASNLSLLSEHLPRSGVAQIEYVEDPNGIVFVRMVDGLLHTFTYKRDEEVVAWSQRTMAGTSAAVESMASIPSVDGKSNTLYFIIKRTINSATTRYIEFFEERFEPTSLTDKDDAFLVDSGATYDGTSTTTITGLGHLEGETVQVLADGAVRPNAVVASSQITLATAAQVVHVGLQISAIATTLPVEVPTPTGTSQGKKKRIGEVLLRFYRSLGGTYGRDESNQDIILSRSGSDPMDSSPPLETGDRILKFNGEHETQGRVTVIANQPIPFTLLAIAPRLETQKR